MWDLLRHDFVQNAFLAGTIVAIVTAVVGYFVVMRAQAFAADSLSHIGMAGATGAVLVGLTSLVGMFLLTIATALGMGLLGHRVRRRDVETGMVLAFALGLGVLFLSVYTQTATATVNVLFGSILAVTRMNVWITLVTGILVLLVIGFIFRPLLFASIDPDVAETRNVPIKLLSLVFLVLLAVTIAVAVQVVGVLLIFALLIAPAAAAEHLTHRPLTALGFSILFALISVWLGLVLGFVGPGRDLPVSFYISILAASFYFLALGIKRQRRAPHRNVRR